MVSTHLVTPTAVLKLISFFLFPLTKKKATSVFRVLANHLTSFSFLHPVRRFMQTTISSTWVRIRGTDSLIYILYFLQQTGWSWPTFLIPLLTVSLWRPVNSNTEGLGKFLISLLSVVDHVTIYIYIYIYTYTLICPLQGQWPIPVKRQLGLCNA